MATANEPCVICPANTPTATAEPLWAEPPAPCPMATDYDP